MARLDAGANQTRIRALLEKAETPDDLAACLFLIAEQFGFKYASLMIMPAKTDVTVSDLVLESNMPAVFFRRMDEVAAVNQCPLFEKVRGSILPNSWALDVLARQQKLLHGKIAPALELYAEYGICTSTMVPLSSVDGARHVVRFDGTDGALQPVCLNDLMVLTMHFFEAYDKARYPLSDNPCGLTQREVEVLHWTSTGKTTAEIAKIMALSDHTINSYLNNAFKKLDCVNRTHLVAKALKMRVIR